MKKLFLFILFFIHSISFAQIQKLNELSSGKYVDSKIVFDDKAEDIYGYFMLYQIDTKAKDILKYEYVLLDKNLNKITSNTFEQQTYNEFFLKSDLIISSIKKIDNEILIEFSNQERSRNIRYHHRYRKLNLDDFELSELFVFNDSEVKQDDIKLDGSIEVDDFIENQRLQKTSGDFFLIYDTPKKNKKREKGFLTQKKKNSIEGVTILDKKFSPLWKKEFSDKYESYVASDSTTFILQKDSSDKFLKIYSIYNVETGFISDFPLHDDDYYYGINDITFNDDDIVLNATFSKLKNTSIKENIGLAKIVLDKKTGKLKQKYHLPWKDFEPELKKVNIEGAFKKDNEIKKYGYIKVQDYQQLDNGKTLIIAEGYKFSFRFGYVLDLFAIELDENYKINYFNKIEKNETKVAASTYMVITHSLPFDYLYSQNLDKEENKVFYFVNNEKEGSRSSKRRNPKWVLGIITYVDGVFNYDKLELSQKDSQIIPGIAKNGYIRLLEIEENGDVELRLEKINY